MENKTLIELFIDESDKENSLDIISFVSSPAIEKDFMYFKKDQNAFNFKSTDEDKRIVTGPAMIPNHEIIRMDAEGKPYFVYFTDETVEKAQEIFAKFGKTRSTNLEHSEQDMNGVTVVESWIVKDPKNDKSNALGFDVPVNTWMVSYKVDNNEIWNKVKSGEVLGFSIEGVFSQNMVQEEKQPVDEFDSIKDVLSNEDLSDDDKFIKIAEILLEVK